MTMSVHQYLCLTDNYGALIHDSTTGATACVDAPEAGPTFAALKERGWTLSDVLLTHHHADHIQGVPELKAKFPNLRVWGPAKDAARIPFLDQRVVEGDLARVGSLAAKVIETPGHTLGHIAYYFDDDRDRLLRRHAVLSRLRASLRDALPGHVELAHEACRPSRRDAGLLRP